MKYDQVNQSTQEGKLYCTAVSMILSAGYMTAQGVECKTPQQLHEEIEKLSARLFRNTASNRFEQNGKAI